MVRKRTTEPDLLPVLPSFYQHGDRQRLNMISFRQEDAEFISAEALRRDCSPADVIREAVREFRRVRSS